MLVIISIQMVRSINGYGHTIEWLEEVAIKNWNQRIKML